MGLFALLVVWVCRTPTTPREGWRLSAEFSIVLLGMLLFSERTWKHHCVTLVLPFAVICYYLATCSPGKGLRVYLIGSLAAVHAAHGRDEQHRAGWRRPSRPAVSGLRQAGAGMARSCWLISSCWPRSSCCYAIRVVKPPLRRPWTRRPDVYCVKPGFSG